MRDAWRGAALTARPVLAALAAGAVVRLALLWEPGLWYDEATVGVMGLAVLRGELPIYFSGQPFMGALDAYLAAPLYLALGPSVHTLKLVPALATLAWLALLTRLAWEAFGPRAALATAAVLAVPPDFLLSWSVEARPHYQLSVALGTLALLLALRVSAGPPRRATLRLGMVGGVLGLAFWTNFLSVVFFPSVAILAVARGLRPLPPRGALAAGAGFVLGSLPHWLYGLWHGTALPPPGSRIGLADLLAHLRVAGAVSWPILAGVAEGLRHTPPGILLAVALAVPYGLAGAAAVRLARHGAGPARSIALALLVLVVVNVGLAVGTEYGERLDDRDQKYLLPLYTALPVLLGAWLARLSPARATVAISALLLVQAGGAAAGTLRRLTPAGVRAVRADLRARLTTIAALERDGPRRLYAPMADTQIQTFLSDERVVFSHPQRMGYLPHARAVDRAEEIGWWFGGPSPVFEANLAALGVRWRFRPAGPLGGAYIDFALPAQKLRELDPATVTVTASDNAASTDRMLDRDAGTFWSAGHAMRSGEWIRVDLGRAEPLGLVRWLPATHQDVPRGLTVETSLDGRVWERVIDLPAYFGPLYWSADRPLGWVRSGRVELRLPPKPARALRITQTGQDPTWHWTVRELFVYAADADGVVGEPSPDGPTLARAVRTAGVTRLYADHGWASRIAAADPGVRILPANLALDSYDFTGRPSELLPRVRWTAGSGALLEPAEAPAFAAAAHAGGLEFRQGPVGRLVLFAHAPPPPSPGAPIPATLVRTTVSRDPGGSVHGRADLATPRAVRALRLAPAGPVDLGRVLRLEGSEDGTTWRPLDARLRTEGVHRWGGIALLRDGVTAIRLEFTPVTLRALRLDLSTRDIVAAGETLGLTVYAAD